MAFFYWCTKFSAKKKFKEERNYFALILFTVAEKAQLGLHSGRSKRFKAYDQEAERERER